MRVAVENYGQGPAIVSDIKCGVFLGRSGDFKGHRAPLNNQLTIGGVGGQKAKVVYPCPTTLGPVNINDVLPLPRIGDDAPKRKSLFIEKGAFAIVEFSYSRFDDPRQETKVRKCFRILGSEFVADNPDCTQRDGYGDGPPTR